jgi:ribosomal protein L11 methyltransferase
METFWIVTLFHYQPTPSQKMTLESVAVNEFETLGVEEFSLTEPEVDEILGERSYSGGDLPQDVLDEVEEKIFCHPTTCRFFFSTENNAIHFLNYVSGEFLCEAQVEEKFSQDWNAEWKKHYSPIFVNEQLEIIPSWLQEHGSQSREKIFIYPGMGFGTGSHETTFLCLKLFTENILGKDIETVLDFGSGSGILGLSVFKFYPEANVDFYDIDSEANKNCYQNAIINKLENRSFRLLLPDFRERLLSGYDLIFANILEGILVAERDTLISLLNSNGFLILSGLLNHQVDQIIKLYSFSGVKLICQLQKGDWSALLFEKSLS